MNATEKYIPAKGPEDFYAYRLGLQVQAYGGAIIVAFGIVGKYKSAHNVRSAYATDFPVVCGYLKHESTIDQYGW